MKKKMPLKCLLLNLLCTIHSKSKLQLSLLMLVLCACVLMPQEAMAQKKKRKRIKFGFSISNNKSTLAGSYDNNAQTTTIQTQVQHGKINVATGLSMGLQDDFNDPAPVVDGDMQNYSEEPYDRSMQAPPTENDYYQYKQVPKPRHSGGRSSNGYDSSTLTYRRPATTGRKTNRVQRSSQRSRSMYSRTRATTTRSLTRYRSRSRQ